MKEWIRGAGDYREAPGVSSVKEEGLARCPMSWPRSEGKQALLGNLKQLGLAQVRVWAGDWKG